MSAPTFDGRIARRLIIYIVLFSSAITLLATAIQLYGEYKRDIVNIDVRLDQVRTSYLQGITEAVWVTDYHQLQIMLDGIRDLPDIEYVEVEFENRKFKQSGEKQLNNYIELDVPLNYLYSNRDLVIGQLLVQASLNGVYRRLIDRVGVILVTNAVKTFLVALFIYSIFNKLVTRHINKIASHMASHDINRSSDEGHLQLERPSREVDKKDEFDALVHAINQMQDKLADSFNALRDSEGQVRLLLESTAEAIYGMDLEGRCTFVNPAFMRMLGFDDESKLLGGNIHSIIRHTRADGTPYTEDLSLIDIATRESRGGHSDEEVHWCSDGHSIPVEWWSHPIRHDKKIVGTVVTFVDISERRQHAEELAQYHDKLESLVDERTDALESFSYSVSHDLRAPLRSINGFSQVLIDDYSDQLDAAGKKYLNRIIANTKRMGRLIDDLLQLSRLSRHELKTQIVDLSSMAESVIKELRQVEPEDSKRTVNVSIQPGIIVNGDAGLLHIVMVNLLGNAWKYTGGKKSAQIEMELVTINGENVIAVNDNGVGFDMQYADKLFGAFQRLHGSEFEGTGIGLVTVQRIIQRHQGKIWVSAAPDKGATIYFTLGTNMLAIDAGEESAVPQNAG